MELEPALEHAPEEAVEHADIGNLLTAELMTTALAVAAILALRLFLVRLVKGKADILDKDQRRWLNRINNGTTVFMLVCLVFIWAPQLHTFALSLTAVAVAIVLTTKELLMCLTGGFLRATTKSFDVGDWITVEGLTGEVMRITALATVVEEIDTTEKTYHFTGRSIQIPNSKFLAVNAENANFIRSYVYYDVPITVQDDTLGPLELQAKLRTITETYFAPLREEAVTFNEKVEKEAAVNYPEPEPQFFLRTTDAGHKVFTVRMFGPTQQAAEISANRTGDFLAYVHEAKNGKRLD